MHILIVGCGAVGGYFGAPLIRAGCDVTFLVRPRTAEVLRRHGLTLHWPGRTEQLKVACVTTAELAGAQPPAFIWVTVKNYDLPQALDDITPVMAAHPVVVTCQNGLGAEELVLQRSPDAPLIGGIAYVYTQLLEPGIIQCRPGGSAAFGAWTAGAEYVTQRWIEAWIRAGLRVKPRDNIRGAKWDKLCWNAVFNAVTAGMRCDVREVLTSPAMRGIGDAVIQEVRAVAQAHRVALDESVIDTYFKATVTEPGQFTSMYVDLCAGRPTEVDWINGAIVRLGQEAGIATPVNRALRMLVKMQERLRLA